MLGPASGHSEGSAASEEMWGVGCPCTGDVGGVEGTTAEEMLEAGVPVLRNCQVPRAIHVPAFPAAHPHSDTVCVTRTRVGDISPCPV